MRTFLSRLWQDESGQGMVEYGLILALIAVAAVVVLGNIGDKITNVFESVESELDVAGQ